MRKVKLVILGLVLILGFIVVLWRNSQSLEQKESVITKEPVNQDRISSAIKGGESGLVKKSQISQPKTAKDAWHSVNSEIEIKGFLNGKPNYKRTYSVIERILSREDGLREKLQPHQKDGQRRIKEALGLSNPWVGLSVRRIYPSDSLGLVTTRMDVSYNGIPVLGSEVIVNQRTTENGVKEELVSDAIRSFPKDLPVKPNSKVQDALEKSTDDLRQSSGDDDLEPQLVSSKLVYVPGPTTVHLAWQVIVRTKPIQGNEDFEIPGKWNYLVDAISGEVLEKFNEVRTETVPQASGSGGNERFDRPWVNELDVLFNSDLNTYTAISNRMETYDNLGETEIITPARPINFVTGNLSNFGNRAANNAHGYGENVLDMLKWFGYNSIDEKGLKIINVVNFKKGWANACYVDGVMFYGDGGAKYFNLASVIDVVSHEIHHGFTDFHSGLGNSAQSHGLNESFSDIAGATARFFTNESGASFLHGDKAVRPNTTPQGSAGFNRDMCEPTRDQIFKVDPVTQEGQASIDHFSNYKDGIDPHLTAGIMNKAFCRFSKRLASAGNPKAAPNREAVLRAARVFYDANKTQWGSAATFRTAAIGTVRSAMNLGYSPEEIEFLKTSWSDVGVDPTVQSFTVNVSGLRRGTINLSLDPILKKFSCNSSKENCSIDVDAGYELSFKIIADNGYYVQNVTGCDRVKNYNWCHVIVNSNKEIAATFAPGECHPGLVNGGNCDAPNATAGWHYRNCSSQAAWDPWGKCSPMACKPGYLLVNEECVAQVCVPNSVEKETCIVENGRGSKDKFCNAEGTKLSYGNCTAVGCNDGFLLKNGVCNRQICDPYSASSEACAVSNGTGIRLKSCSADGMTQIYGSCKASICNSGFALKDSSCVPQVCTPNSKGIESCDISNGKGSRSKNCAADGLSYSYDSCSAISCNSGFTLKNGSCVAQVCKPNSIGTEPCSVLNGKGSKTKTCTDDGLSFVFSACKNIKCNNPYYKVINGECRK